MDSCYRFIETAKDRRTFHQDVLPEYETLYKMKTILWIYEKELIPEDGGTERITNLIMKGLSNKGYTCLGFLEFHKNKKSIIYHKQRIPDVYSFLKDNKIDIVINQLGYGDWLLKQFYAAGGEQWKKEGGKVITCLHFDPKQPHQTRHIIFYDWKRKTIKGKFDALKRYLIAPYYEKKEEKQLKYIYHYLYEKSDFFVMLSKTHYSYFKSLLKLNDYSKLRAIPNPLTFPDISSPEIIPQKKKQVLIVARMSEYHKRISIALKAWRLITQKHSVKDWELVIVGDGPDLSRYKNYVEKYHLTSVRFEGQKNPNNYYKEASIFLMTSSAEGWGLTLTEAMERGLVSIVMESSPVFRDIIDNGETGFIVPDKDLKLFVTKCLYLMNHPQKRMEMARNCLSKAKDFTFDKTINLWENIIS